MTHRSIEAPAGFDTPTLVQNAGSQSRSNGIVEPAGDTFALDQQLIHILPINIVLRKSRSTTDSIPCVTGACPSSGSMSSMTNPTMSCDARMADRWQCRSG